VPRGSSAPGEPIGSGFSALIFFGSFLYQDKKEHLLVFLHNFALLFGLPADAVF